MEAREKHQYMERWQSQRNYYSKNAAIYKRNHHIMQVFLIVLSPIVPALIALDVDRAIPGVLSLIIAIAAGLEGLFRYGERWRDYRQTLEALKSEKAFYLAGAGPYRQAKNPDVLFVERCERHISKEVGKYFEENGKESRDREGDSP